MNFRNVAKIWNDLNYRYFREKTFLVFGMTWPEIEPRSPGPLANTLPTQPFLKQIICSQQRYRIFLFNTDIFLQIYFI